jgi:hypothetical protein
MWRQLTFATVHFTMITELRLHTLVAKITGVWRNNPVNMSAPGKSMEKRTNLD